VEACDQEDRRLMGKAQELTRKADDQSEVPVSVVLTGEGRPGGCP
jgi:hypothetical protein